MKTKTNWILLAVLIVIILIAAIQNHGVVDFQFLVWKMSLSKVILIPLVLVIGFTIGFFAGRRPTK